MDLTYQYIHFSDFILKVMTRILANVSIPNIMSINTLNLAVFGLLTNRYVKITQLKVVHASYAINFHTVMIM